MYIRFNTSVFLFKSYMFRYRHRPSSG